MDADEPLHQEAEQGVAVAEVGEWGGHAAKSSEKSRPAQHPVAEAPSFFTGALVLRSPDVFLDADLRRARDLAELAPGTQVEAGRDRGFLWRTKSLEVRTERLGTAEDVGCAGDRADGVASGALGTGFDGGFFFDGVGRWLELFGDHAASASWAA